MLNQPKVSVIIPTFGHGNLILSTLESVFSQTYSDFEVIVVNDGSPDNTHEILQPLILSGKINYFEQPNLGVAAARNLGIEKSLGQYIALLDDDDLWPPDKLGWQVKMMKEEDAVLIGGISASFSPDGTIESIIEDGRVTDLKLLDLFDGSPFISPGQVLVSREALLTVGGFNPDIWGSDDYDMWMKLAKIGRLLRKNTIALHYRLHERNASKNHLKMVVNSKRVIDAHLQSLSGAQCRSCKQRGYRFMFNYFGRIVLRQSIADIVILRNVRRGASKLIALKKIFFPQVIIDFKLMILVARSLIN